MTRAQLKSAAKAQIKGNIGILFVITLIIGVISALASFVLGLIPVVGSLAATIIVTPAFSLSIIRVYLNLFAGKKPEVKDAFCGFDDFWSAFKVQFLVGLFTFLWSLLFVIPGIIKGFSYSQAMLILAENKGMPALEAISKSKKMMKGHKIEYFVLMLSFIGWEILGFFTFGILYIWLIPYMSATQINFYKSIKPADEIPAADFAEAPAEAPAAIEEPAEEAEEAPTEEAPAEETPTEE